MSYVTVDEANLIIAANYISNDPARARWNALTDSDKTALLNRALARIERLPFQGRKTSITQLLAFPRNGDVTVPDVIKLAQINEALYDQSITNASNYKARGLTSYSIGQFSETFARGVSDTDNVLNHIHDTTRAMLRQYLSGGYNVC